MTRMSLEIAATDGRARTGILHTRRGDVRTPAFMPVGTQATVKTLMPEEVVEAGADIILGNTYHLSLRPGAEEVAALGGLHKFMAWNGPILTDSGGYQVFSLAANRKLDDDGVSFQSHLDGKPMRLTPERAVEAQELLGSDIMMVLDECPPPGADRGYITNSMDRDAVWAARAKAARSENGGALMGIVQGGVYHDLRARSARMLLDLDLDGYALGGLSVGEPKEIMMEVIERTVPLVSEAGPVYLMGVGDPADLVRCAGLGVDMFDCVLPTRTARTGALLTSRGRMNIKNARYKDDPRPVEEGCGCPTCRRFSRAYLRHLYMAGELLAYRLNTLHNLHFILGLMERLRRAIAQKEYDQFAEKTLAELESGLDQVAAVTIGG